MTGGTRISVATTSSAHGLCAADQPVVVATAKNSVPTHPRCFRKRPHAPLAVALEIVVANAQHVRKVPGRKTDVKDAEWIADLLCHGLLRPSFVAPPPIRELG